MNVHPWEDIDFSIKSTKQGFWIYRGSKLRVTHRNGLWEVMAPYDISLRYWAAM